jgi:hypothetical protein
MGLELARREELVSRLARQIARMGLIAPAILFLESYKPLAFLGSQFLWFAQPFLNFGLNAADVHDLAFLLQEDDGVESLIARLESFKPDDS